MLAWLKANRLKFCLILGMLALVYLSLPFLGEDNKLEQAVEWVIQLWTGKDIDLTPTFETPKQGG